MKLRYFLLLSIVVMSGFCQQAKGFSFAKTGHGKVVDSYNREMLKDFRADLMRPDSSLIKSYFNRESFCFNQPMNLYIDSLPDHDCILYVTAEGYYPQFVKISALGKREDSVEMLPVMMNRVPFFKPKELNEVTVTASRVKMVVHGDTITYNADAFALASGSMLDGLIDQLPGVELKSDGKIFVNGKFVDELLVNGDNFFKGDPKIALENLPAYMVNNIQVYHRNDFNEHKPLDELPLIMDVKLKKQYQTGWIANAEAGYGTSDRYLGRLFALMFTRDSRLSIVGNINNTNDDRKPGQTDNWNPNWQSAGRATIASGGIDYVWNSRLRNWKVEANIMAKHHKSDISSDGNFERYLAGGSLFGANLDSRLSRLWRVSTDNKVTYHRPGIWLYFIPTAQFEREKATGILSSSTTDSYGELLNSLSELSNTYRRTWNAGSELSGRWKIPGTPDNINFKIDFKWDDRKFETTTNRSLLFPQQPEQSETSRPKEFLPERKLELNGQIGYGIYAELSRIIHLDFSAKYIYKHQRVHSTRDYFLSQIENSDRLPSVTDALQHAGFIASNSYDYTLNDDRHRLEISLLNWFPHLKNPNDIMTMQYQPHIQFSASVNHAPGNIRYLQANKEHYTKRRNWYVEPKVRFGISDVGELSYAYNATLPELRNMLDVVDAANPLFVYLGNSGLKTSRTHEIYLNIYKLFKKGPRLEATYRKHDNMIAQSAVYDMTTGVTTYRPVNVNGNWDISGNLRFNRKFGTGEQWRLQSTTRVLYQNSIDLIGMDLSTVRNMNLGEKLKLTFKITDGMEISANGNVEWRKATSPTAGFDPISAVDFDYGIIFRAVKLPWDMSFTTDLMMHSRRGYADSRLNTNDLVWNARVAKSILSGNLTFALDGFDILGNLSNVRLTMNSQGRTEMRYNTLPRYAMLHVIYRLNIKPKKR